VEEVNVITSRPQITNAAAFDQWGFFGVWLIHGFSNALMQKRLQKKAGQAAALFLVSRA
jgi:hypothetical protein